MTTSTTGASLGPSPSKPLFVEDVHAGIAEVEARQGRSQTLNRRRSTAGDGEVLVQVRCAGICGTYIHILHDAYGNLQPPVTLGHEFAGVVAGVGPGVQGWREGERVAVESLAGSCGRCRDCLAGETQCCPERRAYGISADGAFADYVVVRETALHRLPDGVSFRQAALTEPLCVAVHAVLEKGTAIIYGE